MEKTNSEQNGAFYDWVTGKIDENKQFEGRTMMKKLIEAFKKE